MTCSVYVNRPLCSKISQLVIKFIAALKKGKSFNLICLEKSVETNVAHTLLITLLIHEKNKLISPQIQVEWVNILMFFRTWRNRANNYLCLFSQIPFRHLILIETLQSTNDKHHEMQRALTINININSIHAPSNYSDAHSDVVTKYFHQTRLQSATDANMNNKPSGKNFFEKRFHLL